MGALEYDSKYCQKKPTPQAPDRSSSVEGSKCELEVSFPRFSREICTFEEKVWLQKIFGVKSSTKMVLMKILVAIVLTELQRFGSGANVKKTYCAAAGPDWMSESIKVRGFGKILHDLKVKFNADFEYDVNFARAGL